MKYSHSHAGILQNSGVVPTRQRSLSIPVAGHKGDHIEMKGSKMVNNAISHNTLHYDVGLKVVCVHKTAKAK